MARLLDYAGATASTTLGRARSLPRRWAVQPKIDGVYARVSLDGQGRIASLVSRQGHVYGAGDVGDLMGCHIGEPLSVLVGELEAQTEAAIRARAARGYPLIHLFDCLYFGPRRIAEQPYRYRYGALQHMAARLELATRDRAHATDRLGDDHDARGRYTRHVPRSWRRAPIVPMSPIAEVERLYGELVERDGAEGLVLVATDAPVSARGCKRKLKPVHTIDARVLSVGERRVVVTYHAGRIATVPRARRQWPALRTGDVVELRATGWTETHSIPIAPRIGRVRYDLMAS